MTMLTDPRASDQANPSHSSGFDTMIAAVLDVHPGDGAYARHMLAVSEAVADFNNLHARMVEHYEDGMPGAAGRYAQQAAATASAIAALHCDLGADFDGMPEKPVHYNDRHRRNQTGAEANPRLDGRLDDPDPLLDVGRSQV